MHRQSIEFVLAALVAAILSMIPNILAKDVGYSWWLIGALTCLFLLMYIIIPRLVWYVFSKNTIKILDTGVYIQFHNQGGNPNVAFFVMWPNFWSSSIYVRGAVYQIVSDNSRLTLKDFGRWSAKSVEIRNFGDGGQAASYFYAGWARDAYTRRISDVTTGMTFLNITNAGVGSGFFIDDWRPANLFSKRHDCFHIEVSAKARHLIRREFGLDLFSLKTDKKDKFNELGAVITKILSKQNEFSRIFGNQAQEFLDITIRDRVEVFADTSDDDDTAEILDHLKRRAGNSYAAYSNFHVSSCITDIYGNRYYGCNLENASYPAGICAESSAVSRMISKNGRQKIARVYVYSPDNVGNLTPCGVCLQRISEFSTPETEIIILSGEGISNRGKLADFLRVPFRLQ